MLRLKCITAFAWLAGMQHVFDVAGRVRGLLDGTTASAASHHGMTTEQERALLGTREVMPSWDFGMSHASIPFTMCIAACMPRSVPLSLSHHL